MTPQSATTATPPFDVERAGANQYRISLALAGFAPQDIDITAEQSALTVEGRKAGKEDGDYLHQGISVRPFRRVFNLSEHMQVKDATFEDGLLRITLAREVPEALKPRQIAIDVAGNDHQKSDRTQAADTGWLHNEPLRGSVRAADCWSIDGQTQERRTTHGTTRTHSVE